LNFFWGHYLCWALSFCYITIFCFHGNLSNGLSAEMDVSDVYKIPYCEKNVPSITLNFSGGTICVGH
jgi:hypothetical protein